MLKDQAMNVFLLTTDKCDMGLYSLGSLECFGDGNYSRELLYQESFWL